MNILIVEDDKIQRENLKKMIMEIDNSLIIYEAEDKDEDLKISRDIFHYEIIKLNIQGRHEIYQYFLIL